MSDMLKINVNEHTEKKNGLTYLSWAWAWAKVLELDAEANWEPMTFEAKDGPTKLLLEMPDETAFVGVYVTIRGITRKCLLPVMDHRNKAIPRPNAFDVNKAMMRCLAKAISMHGLGLYIYAGEDLPQVDADNDPKIDERTAELNELSLYLIDCHQNGKDMDAIRVWYDPQTWSADNPTENEEKKYVWGQLREFSKLRSAIKANAPHKEAA